MGAAALLALQCVAGAGAAPPLDGSGGCAESWSATFGGEPGVSGAILAFAVFDDGGGPALHATGQLLSAGGVAARGVARWDGSRWSPLGNVVEDDIQVHALAVHDDGSGAALYAAGLFTAIGGVAANHIARWDGTAWTPLGSGLDGQVQALAVHDDGGGPALYAGGTFTAAGGIPASRIAKWDGASWSALGSGANATVFALASFDHGAGPRLYAGGFFTGAGGAAASRIASWDGSGWSALGSGVGGLSASVVALQVFDDGGGPALYAGGGFSSAGSIPAGRIARWDGASWSPLGAGLGGGAVHGLAVFDDGSGPALFAGGNFAAAGAAAAERVAKWNGTSWSALASGLDNSCRALLAFDDGTRAALFAGGYFGNAGGAVASGIASWNGVSWSAVGSGLDRAVHALAVFDAGSGPRLHAGGEFTTAGDTAADRIASWDGLSWSPLGGGISGYLARVIALAVFDDGSGPALYAGGSFSAAGGVAASCIARWDGSSWSALGSGLNDAVSALAVYDDGGGPALYAAGLFSMAGGVAAGCVAKWDGQAWSPLGGGLLGDVTNHIPPHGSSLAVFDDGNGPALYVGGVFIRAGNAYATNIARWSGSSWSPVANGVNGEVAALAVFDGGSGPSLYAGGSFTIASPVTANGIARWDGMLWTALGSGMSSATGEPPSVRALAVYEGGSGPALFAGGWFTAAGNVPAVAMARWDGASWSSLGSGSVGDFRPRVHALASTDLPGGPALVAGGAFTTSPAGDSFLARWSCPDVGRAYCFGSSLACPCGNPGGAGEGCANSTGAGATLSGSGSASVVADDLSLHAVQVIPSSPILLFGADQALGGGQGLIFVDGLRCAGGGLRRLAVRTAGAGGAASFGPGIAGQAGYGAGQTVRFQVWYRDPLGPCGAGSNLSNGLMVSFY